MTFPESLIERLVCEVDPSAPTPAFRWYEIPAAKFVARPAWLAEGSRLIVSSFERDALFIDRDVARVIDQDVDHVAFEHVDQAHTARLVRSCRRQRTRSICMAHLSAAPLSIEPLRERLRALGDTEADIVKLAFPAPHARAVALALEALEWARDAIGQPASITPMGTRWGRAAAAAAGSALVFAPARATTGRQSAEEMLLTLQNLAGMAGHGEL